MLDVYSKMLLADTSMMDDAEKSRRSKALSRMEAMLFPEDSGIFIVQPTSHDHNTPVIMICLMTI
jgi:hypothetical protein